MRRNNSIYYFFGWLGLTSFILVFVFAWTWYGSRLYDVQTREAPTAVWDSAKPSFNIWYGKKQVFGKRGIAQKDFNLLGGIVHPAGVQSLKYSLNGSYYVSMNYYPYRRLAKFGNFNADIPVHKFHKGKNFVVLSLTDKLDRIVKDTVNIFYQTVTTQFPKLIKWNAVSNPQEVGQIVDGHWKITSKGLQVVEMGYDRLFLIGNTKWRDYEVTVPITVLKVREKREKLSGPSGLGLIMRFQGHVVGGFRGYPDDQPKWGYLPFGAIGWLRWSRGAGKDPQLKMYHGDSDREENFGTYHISLGQTYVIQMRCQTISDGFLQPNITKYSFKIWKMGEKEPIQWNWSYNQKSYFALARGGVCLVAHQVDAIFGDVRITNLDKSEIAGSKPDQTPWLLSFLKR